MISSVATWPALAIFYHAGGFAPGAVRLDLDARKVIETQGHVVLVTNMPYVGSNYAIADAKAHQDGLLDVLIFANLTKLEVVGSMVQMIGNGVEDPRIQRYRVRQLAVETQPQMPVMADGVIVGEGSLHIRVHPRALTMIAGEPAPPAPDGGSDPQTQ